MTMIKHWTCAALLGMGACLISGLAWGNVPQVAPASVNTAIWQAFLGLAAVIGVILTLAWFSKRLSYGAASGKALKIVAVLPLGTREKALLVDVAGQQLLLGVAPGRVSTLHVFDVPVIDVPAVAAAPASTGTASPDTADDARPAPPLAQLAARSVSEFSQKFQQILRQGRAS